MIDIRSPRVAAAERERYRSYRTGRFGTQPHTDPGMVDVAPGSTPLMPLVGQDQMWDQAEQGSPSNDQTDLRWRKLVADALAPHMATSWTLERWTQFADDTNTPRDTLASRVTVRSPTGDPFYIHAESVTTLVLVDDDSTEQPITRDELNALSPAGLGAWYADLDGCADPEDEAIAVCRHLQSADVYSDRNAAEYSAQQEDIVQHGEDDSWCRDYLEKRKHFGRFVAQCDAWPGIAAKLRYRVSTNSSVSHGLTGTTDQVGYSTFLATNEDDALTAAIGLNQAAIVRVKPEDCWTATGELLPF